MTWVRKAGYGLGLLVLVPVVIAARVLPWRDKYETLTGEGGRRVVAAGGRAAVLDGVEWRLKSVTEGRLADPAARPLPPRTRIAIVLTSMKPLTDQAAKKFAAGTRDCKFRVVDRAGRSWPSSFRGDLAPRNGNAGSCWTMDQDYKIVPTPAGKELTIQTVYVVPEDAFASLEVEVHLGPESRTVRLTP
ncbi:hypothetical protein [Sphaerisporangium corydalis]|uniref:Uncharacterized protein n=1 Tax=Sphaerisporangium corydalis TaxID=1441875 RepID=A0ABV9EIW0_9ACTN|nr:hypothetical protein [Sphaerisporangium corydalis]